MKLAERYLTCIENNKDANSLLKALHIVQASNMTAASWREASLSLSVFVKQVSNTMQYALCLGQRMCGTGCEGG